MTLNAQFFSSNLEQADKDLFDSISKELSRQQNQIELIASENIVSKAVLEAQGSIMTNKYAEGYSAKRYYGGCEFVDIAENLAIDRLKKLYGCQYANVLVLGSRLISSKEAIKCLITFLNTNYEGGRHQARLDKINLVG